MKQSVFETVVGFLVLIVAAGFFGFTYKYSDHGTKNGYSIVAKFQSVDGITQGSDVMIGGVVVGKVKSLSLDPDTFFAITTLTLQDWIHLPKDSQASVASSGFLGGKFISITPGSDDIMLKDHDTIKYTQSSINLESLLGKFIYSSANKDTK